MHSGIRDFRRWVALTEIHAKSRAKHCEKSYPKHPLSFTKTTENWSFSTPKPQRSSSSNSPGQPKCCSLSLCSPRQVRAAAGRVLEHKVSRQSWWGQQSTWVPSPGNEVKLQCTAPRVAFSLCISHFPLVLWQHEQQQQHSSRDIHPCIPTGSALAPGLPQVRPRCDLEHGLWQVIYPLGYQWLLSHDINSPLKVVCFVQGWHLAVAKKFLEVTAKPVK